MSRSRTFWTVDSTSPVFHAALSLAGDPRYVVRERWIDNYLPESLAVEDLVSPSSVVEDELEDLIRIIRTKDGTRVVVLERVISDVTVTSSALRTKEGLGVGNTLGDFRQAFQVPSYDELQTLVRNGKLSPLSLFQLAPKGDKKIRTRFVVPVVRKENYKGSESYKRALGLVLDIDARSVKNLPDDVRVYGLNIMRPSKE